MKVSGYFLCAILTVIVLSADARPQEASGLKPLPAKASLAETQKWLSDSIAKAASYRTTRSSVKASKVKFEACSVSFSTAKQSDTSSTATMGTTKTVTSVKNVVNVDLLQIPPAGIYLTENRYPHLMNIVFSRAGPPGVPDEESGKIPSTVQTTEIVVKKEDAERLKEGFARFARLCETQRIP
jgi:hypothetical protein